MGLPGSPLEVAPLAELGTDAQDVTSLRSYFSLLMKEQEDHGVARGSTTPTAREIQLDQFDWIRRQAALRAPAIPEIDTETLSLWWGYEMGVPPRIMVPALGLTTRDAARRRIARLQERVAADEDLARRLVL
jgi:hypothetical protein